MGTQTIQEGSQASSGGDIVTLTELYAELGLSSPTANEVTVCTQAITKAEGAIKAFLKYDPVMRSRTEFYPQQDVTRNSRQAIWESTSTEAYQRRRSEAATDELQLQHLPIRGNPALQVYVDYDARSGARSGAFSASTLKTEGEDYWPNYDGADTDGYSICRDGILRSIGSWPTIAGAVKVVYTAGYSSNEFRGGDANVDASPIWDATMAEAFRRAKKAFTQAKKSWGWAAGPLIGERAGDYSYSISAQQARELMGMSLSISEESQWLLQNFVNYGYAFSGG